MNAINPNSTNAAGFLGNLGSPIDPTGNFTNFGSFPQIPPDDPRGGPPTPLQDLFPNIVIKIPDLELIAKFQSVMTLLRKAFGIEDPSPKIKLTEKVGMPSSSFLRNFKLSDFLIPTTPRAYAVYMLRFRRNRSDTVSSTSSGGSFGFPAPTEDEMRRTGRGADRNSEAFPNLEGGASAGEYLYAEAAGSNEGDSSTYTDINGGNTYNSLDPRNETLYSEIGAGAASEAYLVPASTGDSSSSHEGVYGDDPSYASLEVFQEGTGSAEIPCYASSATQFGADTEDGYVVPATLRRRPAPGTAQDLNQSGAEAEATYVSLAAQAAAGRNKTHYNVAHQHLNDEERLDRLSKLCGASEGDSTVRILSNYLPVIGSDDEVRKSISDLYGIDPKAVTKALKGGKSLRLTLLEQLEIEDVTADPTEELETLELSTILDRLELSRDESQRKLALQHFINDEENEFYEILKKLDELERFAELAIVTLNKQIADLEKLSNVSPLLEAQQSDLDRAKAITAFPPKHLHTNLILEVITKIAAEKESEGITINEIFFADHKIFQKLLTKPKYANKLKFYEAIFVENLKKKLSKSDADQLTTDLSTAAVASRAQFEQTLSNLTKEHEKNKREHLVSLNEQVAREVFGEEAKQDLSSINDAYETRKKALRASYFVELQAERRAPIKKAYEKIISEEGGFGF